MGRALGLLLCEHTFYTLPSRTLSKRLAKNRRFPHLSAVQLALLGHSFPAEMFVNVAPPTNHP